MQIDDSYCLIKCTPTHKIILCLFYKQYPVCLICNSAKAMYTLLNLHDAFQNLSMNHMLYLGQEIYKAELSLILGQKYTQN